MMYNFFVFIISFVNGQFSSYISDGEEAVPHEFPFVSRMIRQKGFHSIGKCGASIINEKWLITAAHCCDSSEGIFDESDFKFVELPEICFQNFQA